MVTSSPSSILEYSTKDPFAVLDFMLDWEADEQEMHTFPKEPNEDPKNSSCDRENEDCDHLDIPEDHEDDEDDFHDPPELHPAELMHQDTFVANKSITQATKHIMLH